MEKRVHALVSPLDSKLQANLGRPLELTDGRQILAVWHPVFKVPTTTALIEEVTEDLLFDLFHQVNLTHNS